MLVLESLFCLFPPPLLWKGCHDHPVCFLWWTYRFFSPVCSFSLGIHQIVDWATYLPTIHSLQPKWKLWLRSNHRFNCPFNFDASKKTGFVIPKTFPQFGYEMIIKKNCIFSPSDPFSILVPNSTWALQRLLLRSCHVQSCEECLHNKTPKSE